MEKRKKLGVALVGLGLYSEGQLGPALKVTEHCYLAGIVSGSEKKKKKWKKEYDIPEQNIYSYEDFDSIKDNDAIDIVYVVLPNSMHKEFVIRTAQAGKHVTCEKPMAMTVEECDEMIDACKKAGVMLSIGYRLHFDLFHIEMMRLAKEKDYGNVKKIFAAHGLSSAQGWRLDKEFAGGGSLMDVGIYCVNAGRYITDMEPIAVNAKEGPKNDSKKFSTIEDLLTWTLEYPNGVAAECSCAYSQYQNYLRVEAEKGSFEVAPAFSYNGLKGKTPDRKMDFKAINQQAAQMDDFALAVLDKRPTPVPGEMGRQDMKIIEAIYESMRTGMRVEIEP